MLHILRGSTARRVFVFQELNSEIVLSHDVLNQLLSESLIQVDKFGNYTFNPTNVEDEHLQIQREMEDNNGQTCQTIFITCDDYQITENYLNPIMPPISLEVCTLNIF